MSWWAFWGVRLLKLAPRYSLPPDIFFMKPDSRDLVDDPILTLLYRPRCLKLHLLCIPHFCYRRLVLLYFHHPPDSFLRCPVPAVTHRKHHKSSIFEEVPTCIFTSQQDGELGKAQKTLPLISGYAWSWYICCLIKLSRQGHSFKVSLPYCKYFFEVLGHSRDFFGKQSLALWVLLIVCPPT